MNMPQVNPTLDRLFRHMAWANAQLMSEMVKLPVENLTLAAENDEWTVGAILEHLVRSAGGYAAHLDGGPRPEGIRIPTTQEEVARLAEFCVGFDARLREASLLPDMVTFRVREGQTITRMRSTVLAQSIHHAIEHRAQIAGILALRGIKAIDLDAIDVWGLGDAEGLGE